MAVFRVERTGDYTVMSNFHLKDKRLSLKAKGLLSQMLSLLAVLFNAPTTMNNHYTSLVNHDIR